MPAATLTATATAQALHHVQVALYTPRTGLHAAAMSRRRTPDGFSAELHRDLGMWLLRAVFDEWHLQSLLPTEAANDDAPSLPGAA